MNNLHSDILKKTLDNLTFIVNSKKSTVLIFYLNFPYCFFTGILPIIQIMHSTVLGFKGKVKVCKINFYTDFFSYSAWVKKKIFFVIFIIFIRFYSQVLKGLMQVIYYKCIIKSSSRGGKIFLGILDTFSTKLKVVKRSEVKTVSINLLQAYGQKS